MLVYDLANSDLGFYYRLRNSLPGAFSAGGQSYSMTEIFNFVDVPHGHHFSKPGSKSCVNMEEVKVVSAMVKFHIQNGCQPERISVVSGYRDQVEQLQSEASTAQWGPVKVKTIDWTQGGESEVSHTHSVALPSLCLRDLLVRLSSCRS